MENLPLVVLRKLFGLMPSLNEQVKCSHVCRNWRAAFEVMRPETLTLYARNFVPLNLRLFYTNEQMPRCNFLRLRVSYDYLNQFLDSNASELFVNIKKLVVFSDSLLGDINYKYTTVPEVRLRKQINRFKCLEHLEIVCNMPALQDAEIDLPNLKVLSFFGVHQFKEDNVPLILNTPRLQALKIVDTPGKPITMADFKFLFPESLRFIEMPNYGEEFKFEAEFVNVECLIFHHRLRANACEKPVRMFSDDFLKSLPRLKVLYFDGKGRSLDLPSLEAQRARFGMDLKIVRNDQNFWHEFDYSHWQRYVQHKQLLLSGACRCWPGDVFYLVFNKLINCQMPLAYFKEGYLRICTVYIRRVPDQALLVDFLRKAEIRWLYLEYDCNLGQSFFDQIADSLTVSDLTFEGYDWNRLSDPSVLRRLNMSHFKVYFQEFADPVALAVLNNSACFWSSFYKFDRFYDEPEAGGEIRQAVGQLPQFGHNIRRVGRDFYCETCGWISSRHPGGLRDPIKVTLKHIKGKITRENVTSEEVGEIEARILAGTGS